MTPGFQPSEKGLDQCERSLPRSTSQKNKQRPIVCLSGLTEISGGKDVTERIPRPCVNIRELEVSQAVASCGGDRVPQTGRLKPAEMYSILEARSLTSECQQGISRAVLPLKALGENPLPLLASGDSQQSSAWLVDTSLQSLPLSPYCFLTPVYVCLNFFFLSIIMAPVVGLRAHPNPI